MAKERGRTDRPGLQRDSRRQQNKLVKQEQLSFRPNITANAHPCVKCDAVVLEGAHPEVLSASAAEGLRSTRIFAHPKTLVVLSLLLLLLSFLSHGPLLVSCSGCVLFMCLSPIFFLRFCCAKIKGRCYVESVPAHGQPGHATSPSPHGNSSAKHGQETSRALPARDSRHSLSVF